MSRGIDGAAEPLAKPIRGFLRRPGRGPLCGKLHGETGHLHVVRVTKSAHPNYKVGETLFMARHKARDEEEHFVFGKLLKMFWTERIGDCSTFKPKGAK